MGNVKVLILGALSFLGASHVIAQESRCITDVRMMNLQADIQTASLICPKWNVLSRVDYAHLLISLGIITVDDLEQSTSPGLVVFREPCATEISEFETASFLRARDAGLDTFCIDTSVWLTVPNIRFSLEANGVFSSGLGDD